MTYSKIKKAIASVLIAAMLAPNLVHVDFSYGDNLKEEHDLVVLLVEKTLFETGSENDIDSLTGKIYRYADDIRLKASNTKTKIIRVNSDEHPSKITNLLEKYYLEGEEDAGKTEINKLKGIVLIGDIPFPVVKFKHYHIPTVFPYTDFVDPAFVWNEQREQFEENTQNFVSQAEIWHGIIKAPKVGDEVEELNSFFDKNHAFHTGKAASKFDQRVFYADVLHENEKVNSSILDNYFLRNEYTDDLAYLRFNKHFAERVLAQFSKNVFPSYGIDDDGDGLIDEDPINLIDDDGDGLIDEDAGDIYKNVDNDGDGLIDEDESDNIDNDGDGLIDEDISMSPFSGDAISKWPDLQSKKIIEKFLSPYAEVVENYIEKMNTFVEGSGRWTKNQVDSFPALITKLDALFLESNAPPEFNMSLKNMNTHMENALNKLVENSWQKDVKIVSSISVEKPQGENTKIVIYDNFINGTNALNIANAEDCALSHGSPQSKNINLAQQVEYNRLYDPQSAGNPSSACVPYGNCCGNYYSSPNTCDPDNAYKKVKHNAANTEKAGTANAIACKEHNFYSLQEGEWYSNGSIVGYTTNTFTSVFRHDEPRNETIMNAVSSQNVNPNIPADDPRYISFQNYGRRITDIDYFNFFKIKNLSEANDLATSQTLAEEYLEAYEQYVSRKITEQNIDIYKEYLYRYISFYDANYGINVEIVGQPTVSIAPYASFENSYTEWKNQTFSFLNEQMNMIDGLDALTQYIQSGQTNYDSNINSIFNSHFLNGQHLSFLNFVRQSGGVLNLSKSYDDFTTGSISTANTATIDEFDGNNSDDSGDNPSLNYTLNEIEYQVQKTVESSEKGDSYTITYNDSFSTIKYLADNYWLDQMKIYGEEDMYKVVQWLNATLDEKRQVIFENYINQVNPLYPSSAENGYESAYFHTEGSLDYIDLSVEKSTSQSLTQSDSEWEDFLSQNQADTEEEFNEIMQAALEDECGSFTEGVDIWKWPSAIACWMGNLGGSSTSNKCSSGNNSQDQECELIADKEFGDIQQTNPEIQIFLSSEEEYLPTYNSLQKVFVYTTSDVDLNSIELAISQPDGEQQGKIVGENPVKLINGKGATYVKAISPNSKFVVYVKGLNNYESNSIQFTASVQEINQYGLDTPDNVTQVETSSNSQNSSTDIAMLSAQQGYKLAFLKPPKHINYNSDVKLFLELQDSESKPVSSNLEIAIELTQSSKKYAYLKGEKTLDFSNGALQSISLKTLRETGPIYLLIKSQNDEIASIGLEIKVGNLVTKDKIAELKPQALYTTLLGESYADLVQADTIANRFLFSLGKTQAVTTLQGNPEDYPVGVNIYPSGRIEVFDQAYLPVLTSLSPLQISVFDQANLQKEFSYEIGFPTTTVNLGEFTYATDFNNAGIYIGIIEEDLLKIEQGQNEIILQKGSEEILKIINNGNFTLNPNYQLTVNTVSVNDLFLDVVFEDEIIATVALVQSKLKQVLQKSSNVVEFFAEATTKGKVGFSILDTVADKQKINLSFAGDLTSAKTKKGVGWIGDYKNELLFAANNTIGDSTQNYASVFEVLLGDPTVKIKETTTPSSNGFNQTIGKQLLTNHNQQIVETLKLDFNNDNYIDLGVVYNDGYVELLQGTVNHEFENKGELAYLADSISNAQAIDFKQDGYEDLLIVTPENKLILLQNDNQKIESQEVKLNLNSNITKFELAQMSSDQNLDLVAAFSNGDMMIFYGSAGGTFTATGVLIDQLGGKISTNNLAAEILLNYENMPVVSDQSQTELEISQTALDTTNNLEGYAELSSFAAQNNSVELIPNQINSERIQATFISAAQVSDIVIIKKGKNLNGEYIDIGHVIQYTTTLQSTVAKSGIKLTNFIPSNFNYINNSLQVSNCGSGVNLNHEVYTTNYPFLITNIDLTPEPVCEIKYQVTVMQTPKINFWIEDVAIDSSQNVLAEKQKQKLLTSFTNLIHQAQAAESYAKDGYLDIGLNIEGNNTGKIKYLISQEPTSHEYLEVYTEKEELDLPEEVNNTDSDGNGIPDRLEKDDNGDGLLDYINDYENKQIVDTDKDGLPDSWDTSDENEGLDSLTELTGSLENIVEFLEGGCQGGCLDIPINYSFFTPGPILGGGVASFASRLGIEVGNAEDPPMVLPIFAWGHHVEQMAIKCRIRVGPYCIPTPQPIWMLQPLFASNVSRCTCNSGDLNGNWLDSWEKSMGRIYLSPTLTGGLGLAVCMGGEYPDGKCYATALDSITGSLCDLIGLSEDDAKSNSSDTVSTSGQSLFSIGAGASGTKTGGNGGYSIDFDLDNFSFSKVTNVNKHTKAMGSVITDWVNRQIEEVANALLDLPTIYLYYPTFDRIFELDTVESTQTDDMASSAFDSDWGMFDSLKNNATTKSAEQGISGIKGAYDTIKSLPFVTVTQEDVNIKIPYLDKKSLDALKNDLENWKENAQTEIDETKAEWKEALDGAGESWEEIFTPGECEVDKSELTLECKQKLAAFNVMVKTDELMNSIDKNLEIIETYANLPREIIKYKEGLLGYLTQVTCTLNQIIELLGGWIVKNLIRYNLWKKFIATIQAILEGWQQILDVMDNYKNSCETCQAETYQADMWGMVGSMIPEIPIIKFPRWPDIKIDLSQINANFDIVLPRLHFIPDPIVFPKIPNLSLPGPPTFGLGFDFDLSFSLPGIPMLPELPGLPTLPDLPSFNLPDLPDLPPPPKIPEIPGFISSLLDLIDVLLQIYCLIKKGTWIYDEDTIKSTIEALTARPSGFMKGFDFLHLNLPTFSITGYDILIESQVNLELEADYVAEAAKSAVEPWNSIVTNLVDEADSLTDGIYDELSELLDQQDFLPGIIEDTIQKSLDDVKQDTEESADDIGDDLYVQKGNLKNENKHVLNQVVLEMKKVIEDQSKLKLTPEIISELESPNLRRIQKLSKIVEDYQYELEKEVEALKQTEDLSLIAYIPQYQPIQLTSKKEELEIPTKTKQTQYFASLSESEINKLQNPQPKKYIAALPTVYGNNANSLDALPDATQDPSYNYQGAYIYDEATDQVQPLLEYEDEADSIANLLYIDYDNDGDDDILYSMGDDLYLKESYKVANKTIKPYQNTPQISDFDSLNNILQAVKNYQVEQLNNATATVSWSEYKHSQVSGYLIENVNVINQNTVSSKDYYYLAQTPEQFNVSVNGTVLQLDDSVAGAINVQINNQLTLELKENENLYTGINDEEYYKFNIPNGFYYSVIYAVLEDGTISTRSEQHLLAPQIAADKMAPLIVTPQKLEMYLNQTNIVPNDFFLDDSTELVFDWTTEEPQQIISTGSGLQIGTYTEPQNFNIDLTVADEAGNQTTTQMEIDVIAPGININSLALSEQNIITGLDTPLIEDIPVAIYRERFGKTKVIKTPSADLNGKYFTDDQGEYLVNDFDFDSGIIVKDSQNNEIAYIHSPTGQIEIKKNGYTKKVLSAVNSLPTRVVILNSNNKIIANQYFVADYNNDVSIDNFTVNVSNAASLDGVHVFDANLQDKYEFESLPGNAPYYPGGVAVFDDATQQSVILVNVDGKIHIPTTTNMQLILKVISGYNEPIIFEIRDNANTLIGEIYIAVPAEDDVLEILPNKNWSQAVSQFFIPLKKVVKPMFAALNNASESLPFTDINTSHPAYEAIKELYERQILQGYADQTVRPDTKISRAEFVKIALGATTCLDCTKPTKTEKSRYDAAQPFPDVAQAAWYYYCVSKGKEKSMITGYGDGYFRPEQNISRAEAVAILLREASVGIETMPSQYFLDIPDYAWYKDYVYTGVQLGIISSNYSFVIPDEQITRGEFAMMAKKLLDIQDCRLIDTDLDGMPDYWEIQNGLNPENALDGSLDNDNDGIVNSKEFMNDTNPNQKEQCLYLNNPNQTDTDGDGIIDVCDDDIDNDLIKNQLPIYNSNGQIDPQKVNSSSDNCVFVVNTSQVDQDQDGQGDVCDVVDDSDDSQGDVNDSDTMNNTDGKPDDSLTTSSSEPDDSSTTSSGGLSGDDDVDLCPSIPGNNMGCPDFLDDPDSSTTPINKTGIYIVPGDPTECYFIDYAADLRKGDKVFTAVSSKDNKDIWSKSEVVEY